MATLTDKENVMHGTDAQEHTALKQNAPSLPRFVANKASMDTFELPESGETFLFEETERLRQENSILEEELQEVNAEIMSVQEEAFTNEEVLLQRIQFLGQELEAQEADSSETIAQLDCELRSVAVALDRVTIERDNLSDALMEAAREKVAALVKVAELSGLLHHALKKFESDDSGTEQDSAQNELLIRFQAAMDDKLSLQFRLQDAESKLLRMQTDLAAATQDCDIEGEHARLVSTLLEKREQECAQLTAHSDQQAETILELRGLIKDMEQDDQSKENDVYAMAKHLNEMRARLEELQEQAKLQQDSSAAAELELREMFEERITLLQRQMDLIGELASSEFSMIGMGEELDASKQANDSLRSENGLLSRECERLLCEVRMVFWVFSASTSSINDYTHVRVILQLRKTWKDEGKCLETENFSLLLRGTGKQAHLLDDVKTSTEIEDGEIVSVQGSPEAPCKTPSKLDRSLHVLSETENIPSNGDLRS